MTTRVVHCQRELHDIYIGRPSEWGNPFSHKAGTLAQFKVASRDDAIERYEDWLLGQPSLLARLGELRGKTLGCWCSPLPCHGDVLARLAEDAEILAEGAQYGEWISADKQGKTGRVNTATRSGSISRQSPDWPRRIAVVGGTKYDADELGNWLTALRAKYPRATVVTGSSRGAEAAVRESAASLNFTVEVWEAPEGFGREWEVTDILRGADVVVIVGSENAARAKLAATIHKRVDAWRENGRPLVNVAVPPKSPGR